MMMMMMMISVRIAQALKHNGILKSCYDDDGKQLFESVFCILPLLMVRRVMMAIGHLDDHNKML